MNYNENGVLKKLIAFHKYRFIQEIAEILGRIICKQFGYCSKFLTLCEKNLVVPVPLHKSRLKYRGFNQAALLAAILAKNFKSLEFCEALERIEYRNEQANLKKIQRLSNLRDAFKVKAGLAETVQEALKNCLMRGNEALTNEQYDLYGEEATPKLTTQKAVFQSFLHGRNIILVDDVATTLSTLNECSRALKNAGAQSVTGLVLARVERFC